MQYLKAVLFHSGVGDRDSKRLLIVSAHLDGLNYHPQLTPPIHFPILNCKPWFYRNDHDNTNKYISSSQQIPLSQKRADQLSPHSSRIFSPYSTSRRTVKSQTKQGKELIEECLDQPWKCIRDGLDSINFELLEISDLSEISPPGISDQYDKNNWLLVDTVEKMEMCLKELNDNYPTEIGFDMEMYNESKYCQITCLIQLSTNFGKDYVIDVLAPNVWDTVSLLRPIFADPNVVKIGHSMNGMDIPSLHRDFGIFVVNAFDTYLAAQSLNLNKNLGLAKLCDYYGLKNSEAYMELKKEFQTTDWRVRPLSESMIKYGLHDSHYLIKLRELLIRDLTKYDLWQDESTKRDEAQQVAFALSETLKLSEVHEGDSATTNHEENETENCGQIPINSTENDNDGFYTPDDTRSLADGDCDGETNLKRQSIFHAKDLRMNLNLMSVITKSQQACLSLWNDKNESPMKNYTLISILQRSSLGEIKWDNSNMTLYCKLVVWRDEIAKNEGILPGMVCSLDLLVKIALKRPKTVDQLHCLSYFLPGLLNVPGLKCVEQMLSIVEEANETSGLEKMSAKKFPKHLLQIESDKSFKGSSPSDESERVQESSEIKPYDENTLTERLASRMTTMKWAAVGAAVVAFWVGASRPKK